MDSLDNNILNKDQIDQLKNNAQRAKIAGYIFLGIAIFCIPTALSSWFELDLLTRIDEGGDYTEDEITMSDIRQAGMGIITMILNIAAIVTFLNWFRRAYGNMERAGVKNLSHKEKHTIYSFMIPFVSLYRPFQITKEINEKTQKRIQQLTPEYEIQSSSSLIIVWWTLYLISNLMDQIVLRVAWKAETIEQMIRASKVGIIADIVTLPAAIAAYFLIKNIARKEALLYNILEKENLKSIYTSAQEKNTQDEPSPLQ